MCLNLSNSILFKKKGYLVGSVMSIVEKKLRSELMFILRLSINFDDYKSI
ncbi:hypothetical protein GCM10023345_27430 [Acinetobacter kookii]